MNMADRRIRLPFINNVVITGNLTKDPEHRETKAGAPVSNMRIATSRKFKTAGQIKEETCFANIVAWDRISEQCKRYGISKGDCIMINGRLQSREWTASDGSSRSGLEIVAERIHFMSVKYQPEVKEEEVEATTLTEEVGGSSETEERPA